MTSNLPNWPGASSCYSRAYRRLKEMAANGHVTAGYNRGPRVYVSEEMRDLIDALNQGDEEAIKSALLFPEYHAA